jgi:hypothetical protein
MRSFLEKPLKRLYEIYRLFSPRFKPWVVYVEVVKWFQPWVWVVDLQIKFDNSEEVFLEKPLKRL